MTDYRTWERRTPRQRLGRYVLILLTLVAAAISWQLLQINYNYVGTAPEEFMDLMYRMYPPNVGYTGEILSPMIETVHIAILGTALAILMAIPVSLIGAENTTPNRFTFLLGKFIISASRSVNVIIWALIFVIIFGSGALAGTLAIAVRSIGFCSKLIAEAIEEIDPGQVEAIKATGANSVEAAIYGIVPQIKPAFIGVSTYRWDINVRASTIIGFVGAGGIGVELNTSINFFAWQQVLTILLAILGIVIFSEVTSAYLRRKVR
ncbi:phosphonate ABC transporter, permease protein PhnE [Halobellus limi]|uniref:Phosphonate ABC transporter, permease protein PhnE n=1 Tax=Halobellus limi TaxID=699433 RepID=A0A1H6CJX4_9EURY|nr:phosphonate ABC transporter, permease protein PhnE [Halobellus limi]QCC46208.1 phosphonate ABC transporter, permease protein PhnE [Halobellus limi]SEG73269.1 phosphonate transport system permease protein [Halobellus limi]